MGSTGQVDLIRASLDGHAFHHAWAARSALELLPSTTDLEAISIEGFAKDDEGLAPSDAADEVADLTRYRGDRASERASRIEIVQFKYSIASATAPMRAADTAKTVKKFAAALSDYVKLLGRDRAREVVRFELVTNRPIASALGEALKKLRQAHPTEGDVKIQADAITAACGLTGEELRDFSNMLTIEGGRGSLRETVGKLARTIANWGGSSDALARVRFLALQRLVAEKAGSGGQFNNIVTRVDLLGALEIADECELFPAEIAFPPVERVIEREATNDLLAKVGAAKRPLLVHAVGGMGKTVLMQSLATRLSGSNLVVLFDGFGAGRWRDPADGRQQPRKALLQLINQVAARGLCELMLPGSDADDLVRTFRRRLEQAITSLRDQGFDGDIVLLLDAIDHSAMQAKATQGKSFAALLLETLSISPLAGVRIVGSCRTERLQLTQGEVDCELFEVPPFASAEAEALVLANYPDASATDTAAAFSRSAGNPRILNMVLRQGPPFEVSRIGPTPSLSDALDELIADQVQAARDNAKTLGATDGQIDQILAGLALLPPPVPVDELAVAQGTQVEAVLSFVADLFPLIEQTPHGLIFRDEPTETFIRNRASRDNTAQKEVLRRLDKRQETSSYAARAYPAVLRELDRKAELYALAFDDRLPEAAKSGVAQRAIRLARLEAALHVAANDGDIDRLTGISLELARISEGHGRSDKYLRDNPDLVAISADPEAFRRLFEDRGNWPGARHASLAVANLMDGDDAEAWRNARRSLEWHDWRVGQSDDRANRRAQPRRLDVYGPAWVAVSLGRQRAVGEWLTRLAPPVGFAHAVEIVRLLEEHACISAVAAKRRNRLYRELARIKQPPTIYLLAVLSRSRQLPSDLRDRLIAKLTSATDLQSLESLKEYRDDLDGLRQAFVDMATRELLAKRPAAAVALLDKAELNRPNSYLFDGVGSYSGGVSRWLLVCLLRATAKGRSIGLSDIAPVEIDRLVRRNADRKTPEKYVAAVRKALKPPAPSQRRRRKANAIDREESERLQRFIDKRVGSILETLAGVQDELRDGATGVAITRLLDACDGKFSKLDNYPYRDSRGFANRTTSQIAVQLANSMDVIDAATAQRLCTYLEGSAYHHLPQESATVWMLASHSEGVASALKLAIATGEKLKAETSVNARIGQMAALAHALWPASVVEARSYFLAGLQLADSFSSDDIEETYGLLAVAEAYRGPRLSAETVHSFQRLCEMQMSDDEDRYDWRAHAFALARIGGLDALAISSRLLSRGRGGLKCNHHQICAALTETQKLSPELAATLVGVHEYRDWLAFRFTDYLERLLPALGPACRSLLMGYVASEVDRAYGVGIPTELARGLEKYSIQYLAPSDPHRRRFAQLAGRAEDLEQSTFTGLLDASSAMARDSSQDDLEAVAAGADFLTVEGIDAAVGKLMDAQRGGRPIAQLFASLAARALVPDDQIRFLDAIEQALSTSVEDKLVALEAILPGWMQGSIGVRNHIADWAKALSVRHASELCRGGWDGSYWLSKLVSITNGAVTSGEVAAVVLKSMSGQTQTVGRKAWLGLARQLAPSASSPALSEALTRYVRLAAKAIPDDFADGPWSTSFEISDNQAGAVAGLLWSQLGAPDARTRWRAAHAVRRSVELGQPSVLDDLMERINSESAGAFLDRSTNFFFLNAKLWLLLAVARIAIDQPDRILPYRQKLEDIAFSAAFPHVLMRELAARTLISIADHLRTTDAETLRNRCQNANVPAFPIDRRDHYYGADFYRKPPDNYTKAEPEFHFEYDFDKYEVVELASKFGSHKYEIGDKIAAWVRRWSPDATNMWSARSGDYDGWSGSRQPAVEGWNGNLAWHGLFLAAGEMLLTHRVVAGEWDQDPWREWLGNELMSREDGRWLADDTSLTPVDMTAELTGGEPPVPARAIDLLPLAHLDHSNPDWFVVDGRWTTHDGVGVSINSAIVPRGDAENSALALTLMSQHDIWLPRIETEDRYHTDMRPFRAWLQDARLARESGIDDHDPYGTSYALDHVIPSDGAAQRASLHPVAPYDRSWVDGASVKFRTETWGRVIGSGRHQRENHGQRSWAHSSLVRQICQAKGNCLVVVIFARRHLERERGEAASPSRWLCVIIGPDGTLRPITRVPSTVRQAIRSMPGQPRPEFKHAIKVVRLARADRPAGA
jgi:hypothetical protein